MKSRHDTLGLDRPASRFTRGVAQRPLQFRDACLERGHGLADLVLGMARSDVLRAVPIEGHDLDEEDPLHDGPDIRFGDPGDELGILAGVLNADMALGVR